MAHKKLTITELHSSKNIADLLSDSQLSKIGTDVFEGYKIDEDSRADQMKIIEKSIDIAKQTMGTKNTPWPGASNVKYPLMTKASIEFASRQLPEIIKGDKLINGTVVGADPRGLKQKRAENVSKFMSYQLLKESDTWEDDMDKLLHILPLTGTVFKKTYFDEGLRQPVSETCKPDKVVVNHNTKSLEQARRISHKITFYTNDIIERQRTKIFKDIPIDQLEHTLGDEDDDSVDERDVDAPIQLIEQHCYLDLDEDGYKEPYIVIIHTESRKVLRIVNRFKHIMKGMGGEIIRIEPQTYFTDFHFIKSPDGGFYSVGFGTLLFPINAAINTLLNQLIDAGTLANQSGGLIGKGMRLQGGEFRLKPNEWKVANAAPGEALKDNILPLPVKEPSSTLFQLLGLLIDAGKELANLNDILQGSQSATNVPATTILTLVDQGSKVYTAINKRLYMALKKEFMKIYELDQQHITQQEYANVLDDQHVSIKNDFEMKSKDILPLADPNASSASQKMQKAQAMMELPAVDKRAAAHYFLEALQVGTAEIEKLMPPPDPNAKPPADVLKTMAETDQIKSNIQNSQLDEKNKAAQLEISKNQFLTQTQYSQAQVAKMQSDSAVNEAKVGIMQNKSDAEMQIAYEQMQQHSEAEEVKLGLQAHEIKLKGELEAMSIHQKVQSDVIKAQQSPTEGSKE